MSVGAGNSFLVGACAPSRICLPRDGMDNRDDCRVYRGPTVDIHFLIGTGQFLGLGFRDVQVEADAELRR